MTEPVERVESAEPALSPEEKLARAIGREINAVVRKWVILVGVFAAMLWFVSAAWEEFKIQAARASYSNAVGQERQRELDQKRRENEELFRRSSP